MCKWGVKSLILTIPSGRKEAPSPVKSESGASSLEGDFRSPSEKRPHALRTPVPGRKASRRKLVGNLLVIALLVSSSLLFWKPTKVSAENSDKPNIGFRWAFTAMVGEGSEARVEPVMSGMELKSGDQFKMFVELQKACFVYVVYHNAQDEVSMLFPYSLQQFTTGYEVGKKYYIPQGDGWFELDNHAGRETFHLLASIERLTELEHLFNWYASAESAKKPDITRQILTEIRNIKTEHHDLAAAAERPVPIGGQIRGIERAQGANRANIDTISEEITATDFYGKTFTIEHR